MPRIWTEEKKGGHPVIDQARENKGGHPFSRRLGFRPWPVAAALQRLCTRPHESMPQREQAGSHRAAARAGERPRRAATAAGRGCGRATASEGGQEGDG
jgi:hypothetical protein